MHREKDQEARVPEEMKGLLSVGMLKEKYRMIGCILYSQLERKAALQFATREALKANTSTIQLKIRMILSTYRNFKK